MKRHILNISWRRTITIIKKNENRLLFLGSAAAVFAISDISSADNNLLQK